MTTRLSRPEQVERNRKLVLEAARRIFLARGYSGATVDAIADDAGFSKGVVYSQFAGKGDLFLALLEQRIEERRQQNEETVERIIGQGSEPGILELLRVNARRSADDPDWGRLLIEFRIVASRDPALNSRYAQLHALTVNSFSALLERMSERSGEPLPCAAHDLAEFILALDAGSVIERAARPGALSQVVLDDLFTRSLGLRRSDTTATIRGTR